MMNVALGGKFVNVINNAFIGAMERNYFWNPDMLYDMKAFIYWWKDFSVHEDKAIVRGNIGQGSEGPGFIFPHTRCTEVD
jgi:hypothetical protein